MNALILEDDPMVAKDIENKILQSTEVSKIFMCHKIQDAEKIIEEEDFHISFIHIKIGDTFCGCKIAQSIRQKNKQESFI